MDLFFDQSKSAKGKKSANKSGSTRRANDLSGRDWTKFSISVWSDIRLTSDERRLSHPAMFPTMLVDRLIQCFMNSNDTTVLDPFAGSGSTLVAAQSRGKVGIGFEIYQPFIDLAEERLKQQDLFESSQESKIINSDARSLASNIDHESVDLCITSPPYWDILSQKRTADYKETKNYGDDEATDLGLIKDYEDFLNGLKNVFSQVNQVLRPGKYCIVNVMDLRKGPRFFPLHFDLTRKLAELGFVLDDLIIWDRRHEYNNLRSLGYPYTFRINKIHEYLLIFQKPLLQG